ncbi:MAG: hypothetical protein JW874_03420 [Spirochaetales bacterium]|nr:hypothetical protein [Spirochaetales bacterium]
MKKILSLGLLFYFLLSACPAPDSDPGNDESIILPDTTIILDQETLNHLSAPMDNNGTLLFSGETDILENLSYGDIIVSGTHNYCPNGMLRKVTNKTIDQDTVEIQTESASLEEAIQTGSINMNTVLESAELDDSTGTNGMSLVSRCNNIRSRGININLVDMEIIPGVTVNGEISFDIDLNFSLDINNFSLEALTFTIDTEYDSNLQFQSNISSTIDELIEVGRITFAPIDIQIGSFPVVFLPILSLNVGVDGEIALNIETGVQQTASLQTGVVYADGWETQKDFTTSFEFENPVVDSSCRIKGYLGPQMNILLYGVVGPYVNLNGYVELEASQTEGDTAWGLYAGMELGLGVKIEVCSKTIADFSLSNLINYRKQLARGLGAENTNWQLETVADIEGFFEQFNSCDLALDTQNNPHLCFCSPFTAYNQDYHMINYAYKIDSLWVIEEVIRDDFFASLLLGRHISIDLDSNDTPHILFIQNNEELVYCTRTAGQWVKETVTDSLSDYRVLYNPVLVIGPQDIPHIIFHDSGNDDKVLRYAVKEGGIWNIGNIDADDSGDLCDMAIDMQGIPHVLYSYNSSDEVLTAVRYACLNATSWEKYDIESKNFINTFVCGLSISTDSLCKPHVVYDFGEITYMYDDGNSWSEPDLFEDTNIYTNNPSLCLTDSGYPAVAYDSQLSTLKYAQKTATGWIIEHIDNNPGTGYGIKSAIDSDNKIHVVYQDYSKGTVKYARRIE